MYRILGADGKLYGPVSTDQLRRWLAEGRANAATQVLAEGTTEWKPLAQFAEFSEQFAAAAPPPLFAATPPLFVVRKTNGFAITGMILGIFSVTGGLCCYGFPFNILGLIFSLIGLAQIKSQPDVYEGKGVAIAGIVLSILGMLWALGLILFFTLVSVFSPPVHHGLRL